MFSERSYGWNQIDRLRAIISTHEIEMNISISLDLHRCFVISMFNMEFARNRKTMMQIQKCLAACQKISLLVYSLLTYATRSTFPHHVDKLSPVQFAHMS